MYFVFRYIGNKAVSPIPMYVKTLIRDRYIGMGYVRGVPMHLILYFPPTITLLYQEHIHIVYIQIFLI